MGLIIAYYALLVFDLRDGESTILISKIVFGIILTVFTGWFIRESALNIKHINQVRAEWLSIVKWISYFIFIIKTDIMKIADERMFKKFDQFKD